MTVDTKSKPKTFSEASATSQLGVISLIAMFFFLGISLGLLGIGISAAVVMLGCVISEGFEDLIKAKGGA